MFPNNFVYVWKLLVSVDISTRAPWITQNEQHFVAGEILNTWLDAQMEGQKKKKKKKKKKWT
jgi:hypothetical protein